MTAGQRELFDQMPRLDAFGYHREVGFRVPGNVQIYLGIYSSGHIS